MTKIQWILVVLFITISAITFTPIIIPSGVSDPWLFSMPRTLWSGILISILLAILTLIAAFTLKTDDEKDS